MKELNGTSSKGANDSLEQVSKDLISYLSSGEPLNFDDVDKETQKRLEEINIWDWL